MKIFSLIILVLFLSPLSFLDKYSADAGIVNRMALQTRQIFGAKNIRIRQSGALGSISRNVGERTREAIDPSLLSKMRGSVRLNPTGLSPKQVNQWERIIDRTFARLERKGLTGDERGMLGVLTSRKQYSGLDFAPGIKNRSSMATGQHIVNWGGEQRIVNTGARVTGQVVEEDGVRLSLYLFEKSVHELSHVERGLRLHPSEIWYAAEPAAKTLSEILSNYAALGSMRSAVLQTRMAGYIDASEALDLLKSGISPERFPASLELFMSQQGKYYP